MKCPNHKRQITNNTQIQNIKIYELSFLARPGNPETLMSKLLLSGSRIKCGMTIKEILEIRNLVIVIL
jgi:hypothetical protein